MKKINLRDYYPYYTVDKIIEVPDEVVMLLDDFKRQEESYSRYIRRYRAFYSLDADNGIEKDILTEQLSPLEILEQRRKTALLYQGLAMLPEKQQKRIYAYYFLGVSQKEIAKTEGVSARNVRLSISRGLKTLEKFLRNKL